ncbi:MAG: tetratricopeptide repeat protein [Candidatus Eisenbacteria bacterium]|nr:tetratricopeptide repeat protein [Candidatus Eisenbacteria bacterium]
MTRGARSLTIGGLFLLLLFWRVAYLREAADHPLFHHPVADSKVYHEIAERIAAGDGYPFPVFATNPAYPYLLGFFYRVFGPRPMPVAVFQILVGLAGLWLLYRIASRLGGRTAGVLALLIGGLYRPTLFYETFRLPTAIGLFVNLLLLDRLLARRPGGSARSLFFCGLLLGLGTLIQGNLLLLLPLLIVWVIAIERGWRRGIAAGALLLGTALAIFPVTLRNAVLGGDFVPVSSHGGVNFFMGNNEAARGVFSFPEASVPTPENINIHESKRIAEREEGRPLPPSAVSRYWMTRGLRWIVAHPAGYLRLLGRKAFLFWNDLEIPDNVDMGFFQERTDILRRTPLLFGVIAPLGLVGVILLLVRRRGAPLLLFLFAQFASALLFYIHSRYRIPFAGVFAVPAALGLAWIAAGWRRWRWFQTVWTLAILALLFVLINRPVAGEGRTIARAFSLTQMGQAYEEMGRVDEARKAYDEALELFPGHRTALYSAARLDQSQGRLWEAAEGYRAALRVAPDFAEAHLNLGVVEHAMNRNERAVESYREALRLRGDWGAAYYNLGNALFDLERYEKASDAYRRALAVEPENEDAFRNLVNSREKAGDFDGAEALVRERIGDAGEDADLRNRLGDLLEKQGREEEALREYRKAVELNPRHSAAHCNIGLVLFHRGDNEGAIRAWEKILAYDPESPIRSNIRLAEEAIGSVAGRENPE